MDTVALVFYAAVCGALSWAGPRLGRAPVRFGIGVLVGVIAAAVLPWVRMLLS